MTQLSALEYLTTFSKSGQMAKEQFENIRPHNARAAREFKTKTQIYQCFHQLLIHLHVMLVLI